MIGSGRSRWDILRHLIVSSSIKSRVDASDRGEGYTISYRRASPTSQVPLFSLLVLSSLYCSDMSLKRLTLALAMGSRGLAAPFRSLQVRQEVDPAIQGIIDAAGEWPEYVAPDLKRDITEWLAIGDSFAAGISADVPSDELNWQCSRFKQSYPNQMNNNERFPGFATSRKFIFGACTGAKIGDVRSNQVETGDPDLSADHPKIGKPQIGTVSISGNDLGFGDGSPHYFQQPYYPPAMHL